jgi:predicted transcriptional regulator
LTLQDICPLIDADVLCLADKLPNVEVSVACGSDLMSDVLVFTHEKTLLCTGLVSPQVIRTAEVAGLCAIIFVRGKRPEEDVIRLAVEKGIPLLATRLPMYETCGILFRAGIAGTSSLWR